MSSSGSSVETDSSPHDELLAEILAPELLIGVHDLYFAWTTESSSSGLRNAASLLKFFSNDVSAAMHDLTFAAALQPLSTIPLDEFPDLLPFLPEPESQDFPVQALGLHLLRDQAPRLVLRGQDRRWTFAFFGELAHQFADELLGVPDEARPQSVRRWLDLGYGFEAAWLRVFTLLVAFVHAEDYEAQQFGQLMVEMECRVVAETHYGIKDPTLETDESDKDDLTLFPKLVQRAEDGADQMKIQDAVWRMVRIIKAHEPIVRRFGRYPYRNGHLGRELKAGEAEYLKSIDYFECADQDTARKVKEDVLADKWTPLQGGKPS